MGMLRAFCHIPVIFCAFSLGYCIMHVIKISFVDPSLRSPYDDSNCLKLGYYDICYAMEYDQNGLYWQLGEVFALSLFMTIYSCCIYAMTCVFLDKSGRRGFWEHLFKFGIQPEPRPSIDEDHGEWKSAFESARRKLETNRRSVRSLMYMVIDNEEEIKKMRYDIQQVRKEWEQMKIQAEKNRSEIFKKM